MTGTEKYVLRIVATVALLLAIVLAGPGCATKGYVNEKVEQLNAHSDAADTEIRSELDRTARSAGSAAERADEAAREAARARELALGDVDFRAADRWTVTFAFDSAELNEDAKATLDRASEEIRTETGDIVDVYGHADSVGPDAYNDWLSAQRAQTVLRYLLDRSEAPLGRFASIGLGETRPVESGGQEDRDASRRVVVTLLERVDSDTASETLQVSRSDR